MTGKRFARIGGLLLAGMLAVVPAATLTVAAGLAGPRFLQSVDDLPIMDGLTEVANATVVFDKPGGRIVEAYATGRGLSTAEVLKFYAGTLPQLGWQRLSETEYQRESERLKLTVTRSEDKLTLRYDIAPR